MAASTLTKSFMIWILIYGIGLMGRMLNHMVRHGVITYAQMMKKSYLTLLPI